LTEKKDLVYVRYKDHLLFRNSDPNLYTPAEREAVGWIIKENDEAIWILWEKSVVDIPNQRIRIEESGLVLLKSDILEMNRLVC